VQSLKIIEDILKDDFDPEHVNSEEVWWILWENCSSCENVISEVSVHAWFAWTPYL